MRNCIILGSGRSGTSMAAGILSKSGYFMGEKLCLADIGNPKGYFEDMEINGINEDLLSQVVPKRPHGILGNVFFSSRPVHWQRWIARVPVGTSIPCSNNLAERIKTIVAHDPFCFKDPRFCYILPVWRPFMKKDTVFMCVFRHPATTANSLVKEVRRDSDLRKIKLDFGFDQALELWQLMYLHVLENNNPEESWIFIHYNQFLDGSAFSRIKNMLSADLDHTFVEKRLNRSTTTHVIPSHLLSLYQRLCNLSGYVE